MKFRTGKYAGLTIEHVRKIAPWYIQWVRENRPEMLREHSSKPKITKSIHKYKESSSKDSSYIVSVEQAFGMNFPTNKNK